MWHFFPNLDKYVEALKEMADVVGVDHVSIDPDQQVVPGSVQDYSQWVQLVAAMLAVQTGDIAGSNYMRMFRTVPG
jgi:membrane dipeptidase